MNYFYPSGSLYFGVKICFVLLQDIERPEISIPNISHGLQF